MSFRKYLDEGKRYVELNDPVQASEKLYKAAEEAVKALSKVYAFDVYKEVEEEGKWTVTLLFKSVERMAVKLGDEVRRYWNTAWTLHVEGFHETRLESSYVAGSIKDVEELVKLAEEREERVKHR